MRQALRGAISALFRFRNRGNLAIIVRKEAVGQ